VLLVGFNLPRSAFCDRRISGRVLGTNGGARRFSYSFEADMPRPAG
jgi:hypothetical protein